MKRVIYFLIFLSVIFTVCADCAEDKAACYEKCNEECNQKKYDYCRTYEYSGCALDVFCDCNKCDLFDSKWCPLEGYNECAAGPIQKYETCINNCQEDREAGEDVSTCWNDCNDELTEGLIPCKDEQCETSCTAQGYESGAWAYYTASGYDSCDCSGEQVETPEAELFPEEDIDNIEPELSVMESSEPQPFPEEIKPEGIDDPFEDDWDYCSVEVSVMDKLKYLFTSEENRGTKGKVGFIQAVKDKKGIDLYRKGKYYRVGVHTALFPGDRFRVGPNSRMKLILLNEDGTQDVVEVRPNSLFEVEGTRYEDHDDTIRILKIMGSIKATIVRRIQGKKPNFYVKTPSVVAGIRGTEFILSDTNLMVKEGKVELIGEDIVVDAGEQIGWDGDVFGEVEDLDKSAWEDFNGWDEVGKEGFFTIPFVKFLLVLVILAVGFCVYRKVKR